MVTKTSDADMVHGIKQQKDNIKYIQSHYASLRRKYKNKWIVVVNGDVIDSEDDAHRLLEKLSKSKRKDALVYYVADPEECMIL